MGAALQHARLLLMGGGDVAALRRALDWEMVAGWVRGGGQLVSTCAGAYLLRDWLGASVANTSAEPPLEVSERAWSECEEGVAIHVVRGPVALRTEEGDELTAPLFGGPVFREELGEGARVAARYAGVTRGAEWLLADRPEMLQGTPAVLTAPMGEGAVVLSGPHLEHPQHATAHRWLAGLLGWTEGSPREGGPSPGTSTDPGGEEVVRRLASVRRRAASIAGETWRSGEKVWSGERVAGFADAVIPRARALARWGWGPRGQAGGLLPLLEAAEGLVGHSSDPRRWDEGFAALSEASAVLMEAYFASRRSGMSPASDRTDGRGRRPRRLAWRGG